jgi:hypothetical protein
MNRSAVRVCIFDAAAEYAAFERLLAEAVVRFAVRLCAYVLMPNHFHLMLWPRRDDGLSRWGEATSGINLRPRDPFRDPAFSDLAGQPSSRRGPRRPTKTRRGS